jgi:predicted transcriptional regulator
MVEEKERRSAMRPATFKNRTRMEILYQLINAARQLQPVRKTTMMNRSNMSYLGLKKFLDFAMSQGLLEVRFLDESKFYFVTQKGFKFLKLYEELQDIIAPKDDKEFHPVIENS